MASQRPGHDARVLLPQARRVLQVSEQEGHRPRRKVHSDTSIARPPARILGTVRACAGGRCVLPLRRRMTCKRTRGGGSRSCAFTIVSARSSARSWVASNLCHDARRPRKKVGHRASDLVRVHFGVTASDRHCPRLTAMLCHGVSHRPARSSTSGWSNGLEYPARASMLRQESVSTNRSTPTDSCDRTPAMERLEALPMPTFCAGRTRSLRVDFGGLRARNTLSKREPSRGLGTWRTNSRLSSEGSAPPQVALQRAQEQPRFTARAVEDAPGRADRRAHREHRVVSAKPSLILCRPYQHPKRRRVVRFPGSSQHDVVDELVSHPRVPTAPRALRGLQPQYQRSSQHC